MPFLIDGHNLIPKVGLHLDSVDDELGLIALLQEHSRRTRTSLEVFFDGAPAGQAGSRKLGRITAIFVSQASSADAAIRHRLQSLGGNARNWTVVSSDREVLRDANTAHARTETAEEFALQIRAGRLNRTPVENTSSRGGPDGGLSEADVQHWLEVFKKRTR
jgi:hypothetical protein